MKPFKSSLGLAFTAAALMPFAAFAGGKKGTAPAIGIETANESQDVNWGVNKDWFSATLRLSNPNIDSFSIDFTSGQPITLSILDDEDLKLPDGVYSWELQVNTSELVTRTTERSQGGEYAEEKGLKASGVVSIINGSFVVPKSSGVDSDNPSELKDQVILDDLIVDGSIGVGMDAVNGEAFGFDTIRLKENNLRIKFQDTSNSASFPTNDWQITANDSSNGGANKFSIDDIDGGRTPFTILAGAPSHSLFVHNTGRLGLGTSTPVVELHMVDGDSPTMRLQQDGSSGFTPQTWDVAGNETNFFIRDATNGSTLPFRIMASAPKDAFVIAADGDIGIGTASPTEGAQLDVIGNLRVDGNIEQTGNFSFAGDFGVGTTTPSAKLDVVGNLEVNGNTEVTGNLGMGHGLTSSACAYFTFGQYSETSD